MKIINLKKTISESNNFTVYMIRCVIIIILFVALLNFLFPNESVKKVKEPLEINSTNKSHEKILTVNECQSLDTIEEKKACLKKIINN